ncbi:putative rRNA methylase YtqB [Camellia lanceoleosa]|uniref:rRNA methylase YtqB n=1 Tax=Camellia lanceoleosa TaxID=1840588 RepID=A0ACC0H632_9ERIC|nr:putative rRNA methylase YtqB [Camellia lanceoleosa]
MAQMEMVVVVVVVGSSWLVYRNSCKYVRLLLSPFFPSSKTNNFDTSTRRRRHLLHHHRHLSLFAKSIKQQPHPLPLSVSVSTPPSVLPKDKDKDRDKDSPLSGLEDVMMGYIFGKKKAIQVAHSVWRHLVQKGDTAIDATCGNGYDTLAMVKMVADKTHCGHVYAMDVQKVALENASSLLDESLTSDERGLVELFAICHSKMEEVVPKGVPVRLVAFNLGYLPGGDKALITRSETTLQALEAAKRMLAPGGLISIVVYVGHPGGREEYEAVQAFASGLPVENWICCKLQMLNRPLAPILVLVLKR